MTKRIALIAAGVLPLFASTALAGQLSNAQKTQDSQLQLQTQVEGAAATPTFTDYTQKSSSSQKKLDSVLQGTVRNFGG